MKKIALFAFNGDPICFVHVLLNALDFADRGWETIIVIEGSAAKLVETLAKPEAPLHGLYSKTLKRGMIEGVCEACAGKMGTTESAKAQGIALLSDISGHPSIPKYIENGWEVMTF